MCFSAQASFTASALLAIIGVLSLYKMPSKKYAMCAAIPFFFALQQLAEGIIWVTINSLEYDQLTHLCMYTFIFFAWIFWPTWVPTTLWYIEPKKTHKQYMLIPMIIGSLFSLVALKGLLSTELTVNVGCNHIIYEASDQWPFIPLLIIYCIAVIAPFLISSIKHMWIFGLGILISLCISYYVWYEAMGSVWCFFAALISASILYFVSQQKR